MGKGSSAKLLTYSTLKTLTDDQTLQQWSSINSALCGVNTMKNTLPGGETDAVIEGQLIEGAGRG